MRGVRIKRPPANCLPVRFQVKVAPEYKRNFAPEGAPPMERTFATVMYGNDRNVAELLISEGLAQVVRTGQVTSLPFLKRFRS